MQEGKVAVDSNGTATVLGAGDVIILATCPSDDSYSATTITVSFKVNKASALYSINFDGLNTKNIKNSEPSINAPNDYKGKIIYYYKSAGADDSAYTEIKPSKVGNYTIKAVFDSDDNYLGGTAYADFTVEPDNPDC